jgi:Pentapeptide repeats (8 copies)
MPTDIKHKDGHVLKTIEADSLAFASLAGENLDGADFQNVRFGCAADLGYVPTCRVAGAKFDGAILRNADFSGSDVSMTSFRGADLTRARFDGARINWCSPDLIAELVRAAVLGDRHWPQLQAVDVERLELGALILLTRTSWDWYLSLNHSHEDWLCETLRPWMHDDDMSHPGHRLLLERQQARRARSGE